MIKPKKIIGNKVLVRLTENGETKTKTGLIIPATVNLGLEQAVVDMISEQVINIAEGEKVLYPAGAGLPCEYDGIQYKYLNGPTADSAGDIWAII